MSGRLLTKKTKRYKPLEKYSFSWQANFKIEPNQVYTICDVNLILNHSSVVNIQ